MAIVGVKKMLVVGVPSVSPRCIYRSRITNSRDCSWGC